MGQELQTVVELQDERYIWDMLVHGQYLYLATGTEGKLLRVDLVQDDAEGQPAKVIELLDAAQSNLLCLAIDSQGRICTGSDTDGLVYRVTVTDDGNAQVFVLFDAPQPEIGTLLAMQDGTIYAATADAQQAKPGQLEEATQESGRPEMPQPADDALPKMPPKPQPQVES